MVDTESIPSEEKNSTVDDVERAVSDFLDFRSPQFLEQEIADRRSIR